MSQLKFGRICNSVVMVLPSGCSAGKAGTVDPIDKEVVGYLIIRGSPGAYVIIEAMFIVSAGSDSAARASWAG
jgi:hypothetical protein